MGILTFSLLLFFFFQRTCIIFVIRKKSYFNERDRLFLDCISPTWTHTQEKGACSSFALVLLYFSLPLMTREVTVLICKYKSPGCAYSVGGMLDPNSRDSECLLMGPRSPHF